MPHAGSDLLFGARLAFLAAALLVGCSGDDEMAPVVAEGGAAASYDASPETARDARGPDVSSDTASRPDTSQPDAPTVDVSRPDVAADVPELALCLRLDDPQDSNHVLQLSLAVNDKYIALIAADCRVGKTLRPTGGGPALVTWRNAMYAFNLDLWGCTIKPATSFALVSTTLTGTTSADVARLIDLYIEAAKAVLTLTNAEAAQLRRDLERLGPQAVTNESTEFSLSTCAPEGGAGDAPADAKGPGDADASARADADGSTVVDAASVDVEAAVSSDVADAGIDSSDASVDAMEEAPGDAAEVAEGGDEA